ncbi:50S ribosomal protein L20 [bacterium]|nr:50S ribosomal protein L20 [bacterium]
MSRVKKGKEKQRKKSKILKSAKGYWGTRSHNYRPAREAVEKARLYAYRDRKTRKRNFRKLWIVRIKAAAEQNGISYNQFIHGLKKMNVQINRKMLADLAVNYPHSFLRLVQKVKKASA